MNSHRPMPALHPVLLAARPKTLPAAVVPVWAGCVLAWKLTGELHVALALCTLAAALCIQIATNFFNDAIDHRKGADTADRLGPVRVTARGLMEPARVMRWALGFCVAAAVFGAVLASARGWPVIAIGIPSLLLAYGYTGGPFPLAYRGLGELFVLIFFGWIAVAGTVFIQTGAWPHEAWLLGTQAGLLAAVLISINNLRDRAEDAGTGKRTLAVRLGPRYAVAIVWLEIKCAAFLGLGWIVLELPYFAIASLPVFLLGLRILWGLLAGTPGPATNRLLALAGAQLVCFAALFHIIAVMR